MGWDVAIVESGNGGDMVKVGNDVGVFYNDENEIYLRMFGGNPEGDYKARREQGVEDLSYWGNFLFGNDPRIWFNSFTERALKNNALSSQGRVNIETAIKKDLEGLNVDVTVEITGLNRIKVLLKWTLPNGSDKIKELVWSKNAVTGDFDLNDFDSNDFF